MKKERTCNTFEGKLVDETHVEFLGCSFECSPVQDIEAGQRRARWKWTSSTSSSRTTKGTAVLTGEVKFILYKGNHYHLTVFTDWDEDIFVDTNDVWDDGDRVGIGPSPLKIYGITLFNLLIRKAMLNKLSHFFMRRRNWTVPYALFLLDICHSTATAHRALRLYGRRAFTFANFRKFMMHPKR